MEGVPEEPDWEADGRRYADEEHATQDSLIEDIVADLRVPAKLAPSKARQRQRVG